MKEKVKIYQTASDFRRALEERLLSIAKAEEVDVQRLRKQVAFDRFLGRLFSDSNASWALKGGYAMELRVERARATRDIDLSVRDGQPFAEKGADQGTAILEALQEAASRDLKDYFVFLIGSTIQDLDGPPYGGMRYSVEAELDGRTFTKFHLDVGVGDPWLEPLELLHSRDWLRFAGIESPSFRTISREQQFAEKIHAYTRSRGQRENSRVRDLVDLVLLIRSSKPMDQKRLMEALALIFRRYATHDLPESLPAPPAAWERPFAVLAEECELKLTLDEAFHLVKTYYERLRISKRE